MTTTRIVRRRDLLLGLGAGAAFLTPFYRRTQAWAQGKPGVGNFIMFYTPNGFARSEFGSDGNDAGFKFRGGMAKAEPMRQYISVVRGLSNKAQTNTNPFHDQFSRFLTGISGQQSVVQTGYGPSLDQSVSDLAGNRPLTLKVYWSRYTNGGTYQYVAWKMSGYANRLENDPRKAYKDVFGVFMPQGGDNGASERLIAQQKSMLDFLKEDINLFKGRLRAADRTRLDLHLDAIRDYEGKLAATPSVGGGAAAKVCSMDRAKSAETTPPPDDSGPYDVAKFVAHGNIQASLMAAAIGCGARNAGLIMWQGSAGGINPNGMSGPAGDHHLVSHGDGGRSTWVQIDNWYAGRFASYLKELQDVGVLDDTAVVWGSDIAESHSHNNCTFVVGGGKNLGLKPMKTANFPFNGNEGGGRSAARASNNRSHTDLWTTIYKACGGKTNFGEDVTGPINEIWSPA